MASGAFAAGFPAVVVEDRQYWMVARLHTPLQYVLENAGTEPLACFSVDLFPPGDAPLTIAEVDHAKRT